MKIAVFTSGRQDWGILAPVVRSLHASPLVTVIVIASGMHCRDGRRPTRLDDQAVDVVLPLLPLSDDDLEIVRIAAETTNAVAGALRHLGAEALLLVGDRTETLAAGMAATCLRIPLIHLHGGEETLGAIDNACRHALTKLAHLHMVAHPSFRDRLITMGESPDRVVVSGAPAIDAMLTTALVSTAELTNHLGVVHLGSPLLILTHHPTTLGGASPQAEIAAVIAGIERAIVDLDQARVVMTRANTDAGGAVINSALAEIGARDPRFTLAGDLGTARYWSLLSQAHLMIGNSSSGILEAPSFALPVVNIGDRQRGRLRIHQVHDVPPEPRSIAAAVSEALNTPRPVGGPRPSAYGDGRASERIRGAIESFAALAPALRLVKGELR